METTITLREETIKQLQDLIRINIDAAKGFYTAADQIENEELASMFRSDAALRRHMAEQLRGFVELNDEDVDLDGSLKGKLHRWWIGIRGTIQDGEEYPFLAEAERGEDAIKACYEDVLKHNPNSAVSDLLNDHLQSVRRTHDRIRGLRDAWKKANS